jgi:hypothetical protein
MFFVNNIVDNYKCQLRSRKMITYKFELINHKN